MPDVIEPASSGRARCRGCGENLPKGELRFGERVPNPFGDGEATFWFHVPCAAFRRPERYAELVESEPGVAEGVADADTLYAVAKQGVEHHRLPRIAQLERAKSGRAKCRQCGEPIEKGIWRIVLTIWEEGRFNPMGFVHVACSGEYFGTADIEPRLTRVATDLEASDWDEVRGALA